MSGTTGYSKLRVHNAAADTHLKTVASTARPDARGGPAAAGLASTQRARCTRTSSCSCTSSCRRCTAAPASRRCPSSPRLRAAKEGRVAHGDERSRCGGPDRQHGCVHAADCGHAIDTPRYSSAETPGPSRRGLARRANPVRHIRRARDGTSGGRETAHQLLWFSPWLRSGAARCGVQKGVRRWQRRAQPSHENRAELQPSRGHRRLVPRGLTNAHWPRRRWAS